MLVVVVGVEELLVMVVVNLGLRGESGVGLEVGVNRVGDAMVSGCVVKEKWRKRVMGDGCF